MVKHEWIKTRVPLTIYEFEKLNLKKPVHRQKDPVVKSKDVIVMASNWNCLIILAFLESLHTIYRQ